MRRTEYGSARLKTANGEQVKIYKEVIVACMTTLFLNSPGYTEKKH